MKSSVVPERPLRLREGVFIVCLLTELEALAITMSVTKAAIFFRVIVFVG